MKLGEHLLSGIALCVAMAMAGQAAAETEADRIAKLLLTAPVLTAEPGFAVNLLVPPGELYDPFYPFFHDGAVWVTDSGPNMGATGSRITAIDAQGHVSVVVPATTSLSMIAGGFAPAGFGRFSGQLIMVSQQNSTGQGTALSYNLEQLDPAAHYAPSVICTLPNAGESGNGVAGYAEDARFGPSASAFAGRFFVATALNSMIYQMDSAGKCAPFADFGKYGIPAAFRFTNDGKHMLVTIQKLEFSPAIPTGTIKPGGGLILRVSPDGKIEDKPLATGFDAPAGIAVAPSGFGAFAGQIFVVDEGAVLQYPPPLTQRLKATGKVYRITQDGQKHLVASGFINPVGAEFIKDQLWVTDDNAIYFGPTGGREYPDGFIGLITAK